MFTGIIEETGKVKSVTGAKIVLECSKVLENTKLGDSIAVNGVCLTVVQMTGTQFTADVSPETIARTSLKNATPGRVVNLERAMQAGGRMGGHIVQGHVDDTAQILSVQMSGEFWNIKVAVPEKLRKYIAEKGSVTVDGISLTVAKDLGDAFTVAVIPHTYKETNLAYLKPGDIVNIEVDVIARYIEKMINYESKDSRLLKLLSEM